jgi:hypothetical protein
MSENIWLPNFSNDGFTDDELWVFIRCHRDNKLKECDWTQIADAQCDKALWATYRQALRDLPANTKDPKKIVFPTRPA